MASSNYPQSPSFFGRPAPILGSDLAPDDTLSSRVSAALSPTDAVEEMWVADIVDLGRFSTAPSQGRPDRFEPRGRDSLQTICRAGPRRHQQSRRNPRLRRTERGRGHDEIAAGRSRSAGANRADDPWR
jgi:hypothetical protein